MILVSDRSTKQRKHAIAGGLERDNPAVYRVVGPILPRGSIDRQPGADFLAEGLGLGRIFQIHDRVTGPMRWTGHSCPPQLLNFRILNLVAAKDPHRHLRHQSGHSGPELSIMNESLTRMPTRSASRLHPGR